MEISQHIKDLLFTHDRVILSGFGAFIAKYTPAKINEETKTISPPSKKIIFDPQIIKDGGLLEGHMGEREKISIEESGKQIDEYVKTVISKLNAGKKVKFPDLGTFSKSKEGIIKFHYEPSGNLLLDSYGLPKISLPEKVINIKSDGKKKISMPKDNVSSSNKWIVWTAIPVTIALIFLAIYFFKPNIWNQGKTYVTNLIKPSNKDSAENIKDTVKNNNVINTDNTNELVQNNNSDNTEHNNVHSGENKNIINPENNSTQVVNNSNRKFNTGELMTPSKGKYYLIIGSLPNMELAEKETERFRKLGIKSNIIPSGESRYRISLGEFASSKEATAFYDNFHTKHKNINLWLWENK